MPRFPLDKRNMQTDKEMIARVIARLLLESSHECRKERMLRRLYLYLRDSRRMRSGSGAFGSPQRVRTPQRGEAEGQEQHQPQPRDEFYIASERPLPRQPHAITTHHKPTSAAPTRSARGWRRFTNDLTLWDA
jgi:hypothetical protein